MRNLFLLVSFVSLSVSAQDVIVKKDGSTILSKVLEVNQGDIKYKKYSNLEGPTYTIDKSDILSINYENGEKDVFVGSQEAVETSDNSAPQIISKEPDKRNAEIISLYNRIYTGKTKKKNDKDAKNGIIIWGLKSTSMMSNEDVEMLLVPLMRKNPNYGGRWERVYTIHIRNKSSKTIYIDRGNCFRVDGAGKYHCYYDSTEQLIETHGKSSGVSLGLGSIAGIVGVGGPVGKLANGVSVGSGSSNSVSRNYSQQRIIAIPAGGERDLCVPNWVMVKGATFSDLAKYETVEDYEPFDLFSASFLKRGEIKIGEEKIYNENDLQYSIKYIMTYSTTENFVTYSTLEAELYIHEIIACKDMALNSVLQGSKLEKYVVDMDSYSICGRTYFVKE